MQQALSKGGHSHQGLDSAAVIAIAVLAACLAIVFLMAIAILIVYYQRVKVSLSSISTRKSNHVSLHVVHRQPLKTTDFKCLVSLISRCDRNCYYYVKKKAG